MSLSRRFRLSRILGAVLACIAGLVVLGLASGIRLNLNDPSRRGFLLWGATSSSDGAPTVEQSYRMRDKVLAARFAALKRVCDSRWASDTSCLAQLGQMRALEEALVEDVRAHEFTDITESDYWHRGRLEFPSELQQEFERVVPR